MDAVNRRKRSQTGGTSKAKVARQFSGSAHNTMGLQVGMVPVRPVMSSQGASPVSQGGTPEISHHAQAPSPVTTNPAKQMFITPPENNNTSNSNNSGNSNNSSNNSNNNSYYNFTTLEVQAATRQYCCCGGLSGDPRCKSGDEGGEAMLVADRTGPSYHQFTEIILSDY